MALTPEQETQFISAGTSAVAREMHNRIHKASAALCRYNSIRQRAGGIDDPYQRMDYVHEQLESMSIDDLVMIAGACDAGLFN